MLIKLCHHKERLGCSQTIEVKKFLLLYWNKPGIQLHSQQAAVSLLEWMPEGLKISIFTWFSLFLLNTCQGSNVWDLHPHLWRHSACRTSRDCAIKIHSAARNCDNGGKMTPVHFCCPVTLFPRNTETVSWPCRLTQPQWQINLAPVEANWRGQEVLWLFLQARSLEASVTLWEWKCALYISLKSAPKAGGVSEVTTLKENRMGGCCCTKIIATYPTRLGPTRVDLGHMDPEQRNYLRTRNLGLWTIKSE